MPISNAGAIMLAGDANGGWVKTFEQSMKEAPFTGADLKSAGSITANGVTYTGRNMGEAHLLSAGGDATGLVFEISGWMDGGSVGIIFPLNSVNLGTDPITEDTRICVQVYVVNPAAEFDGNDAEQRQYLFFGPSGSEIWQGCEGLRVGSNSRVYPSAGQIGVSGTNNTSAPQLPDQNFMEHIGHVYGETVEFRTASGATSMEFPRPATGSTLRDVRATSARVASFLGTPGVTTWLDDSANLNAVIGFAQYRGNTGPVVFSPTIEGIAVWRHDG